MAKYKVMIEYKYFKLIPLNDSSPFLKFSLLSTQGQNLFIFAKNRDEQQVTLQFDAEFEQWEVQSMPQKFQLTTLTHSRSLIYDDSFLIIQGGYNKDKKQSIGTTTLVNLKNWEVFDLPPSITPRFRHGALFLNKNLYIVGGCTDANVLSNQLQVLNFNRIIESLKLFGQVKVDVIQDQMLKQSKWSALKPCARQRYDFSMIAVNQQIYLLGGKTFSEQVLRIIECFDPQTQDWTLLQWKLPIYFHGSSIASISNSEILILGGQHKEDFMPCSFIFDLEAGTYQARPTFSKRFKPQIVAFRFFIYLIGGDSIATCEQLNLNSYSSQNSAESYQSLLSQDILDYPSAEQSISIFSADFDPVIENKNRWNPELKEGQSEQEQVDFPLKPNDKSKYTKSGKPTQSLGIPDDLSMEELRKTEPFKEQQIFDWQVMYLFGTPHTPFILKFDAHNDIVTEYRPMLNLALYFYSSGIRLTENLMMCNGGVSPYEQKTSASSFLINMKSQRAFKLPKMLYSRSKFPSYFYNKRVYITGGLSLKKEKDAILKNTEYFDFELNQWIPLPEMNLRRCSHCMVICNNIIYVFGGFDGKTHLNAIEMLDLKLQKDELMWRVYIKDEFALISPLKNAMCIKIKDDDILILGGTENDIDQSEITKINFKFQVIQPAGMMGNQRSLAKTFMFFNRIYSLGGSKEHPFAQVFQMNGQGRVTSTREQKVFSEFIENYFKEKYRNLNSFSNA